MTLDDMRTLLGARLGYDLDNVDGESPTDPQLNVQLNYGQRRVARMIMYHKANVAFTTTTDTPNYRLDGSAFAQAMVEVWLVRNKAGNALTNRTEQPGLYSYQEFNKEFPAWQGGGTHGTVLGACQFGNELWLTPKPDASAAGAWHVDGLCLPVDLAGDSDVSELPIRLHEIIVELTAVWVSDPSCSDAQALNRISRYQARANETIQDEAMSNYRMRALMRGLPPVDPPTYTRAK